MKSDKLIQVSLGDSAKIEVGGLRRGDRQSVRPIAHGHVRHHAGFLEFFSTVSPSFTGQVFDQPATAATGGPPPGAGFGPRASAVAGSFFDAGPAEGGRLSADRDRPRLGRPHAIAILGKVAEAAGPGGRVFVVEKVTGDQVSTGMNLRILVYMKGKERGVTELAALGESGRSRPRRHPRLGRDVRRGVPRAVHGK